MYMEMLFRLILKLGFGFVVFILNYVVVVIVLWGCFGLRGEVYILVWLVGDLWNFLLDGCWFLWWRWWCRCFWMLMMFLYDFV